MHEKSHGYVKLCLQLKTGEEKRESEGENKIKCILELVSEWKIRKAKQMSDCESIASGHVAFLSLTKELTLWVNTDSIRLCYQYAFEPRGTRSPSLTAQH